MNSWDCFDTLIARRFYHPYTVFDEVGKRLKIKNFRELRISAEINSDNTYEGIYKNLPGIDPGIEKQVELEHCFPILENLNKVQDGDLILSDIYHTAEFVEKLLRNCGLTKNVKFVVTADGKSKGWIWNKLPSITLHVGDNERSDIKSAKKHGITAELYTGCHFTPHELKIKETNEDLACWIRYVRLSCPYQDDISKSLWMDQANFNLPVLTLASLELPKVDIAFNFRDCVYWKPLYEAIFNCQTTRFDSSRYCYNNPSPEYTDYVHTTTKNKLIVDLQGTGKSAIAFFNNVPNIMFICGIPKTGIQVLIIQEGDAIERHNCAEIGTLIGWNSTGGVRAEIEFNPIIPKVQSQAMSVAISAADKFKPSANKETLNWLLLEMNDNFTYNFVKSMEHTK